MPIGTQKLSGDFFFFFFLRDKHTLTHNYKREKKKRLLILKHIIIFINVPNRKLNQILRTKMKILKQANMKINQT